jgi:hypothetical protein
MSKATTAEKAPTLKQLDAEIKRAAAEMAKAKPESDLYVKARKAKDKPAMDKHREGRQAHERAEAKRRELRKQRAKLYPNAPKL